MCFCILSLYLDLKAPFLRFWLKKRKECHLVVREIYCTF